MHSSWTHKLYWCRKVKDVYQCRLQLKHVNYWMPRSFVWKDTEDVVSLKKYIDAIHAKDKTISSLYEDKNLVDNLEYEEAPPVDMIRVDPVKLLAILRGEYVLEIPCTGRIIPADPERKGKYMPQDIAAPLLAADGPLDEMYTRELRARVASGLPILCLNEKELTGKAVREANIELWNPGINIQTNQPAAEALPVETNDPLVEKEIEISRIDHGAYIESVSSFKNYFIRRLTIEGHLIYGATSYDRMNWSVFYIEQVAYDTLFQPEHAQ